MGMRLSPKESRMVSLNATNLDRKSGIRGPKTMGEAHQSLSFRTTPSVIPTGGIMLLRPHSSFDKTQRSGEICVFHGNIDREEGRAPLGKNHNLSLRALLQSDRSPKHNRRMLFTLIQTRADSLPANLCHNP